MTQYVRAINIANNSIKSFVFDTNTANTLNNAAVAEAVAISANVSAQAVNTFVTLQVQQVANIQPQINTVSIADSSYTILDDTAANTSGGYLVIKGTNFQPGAIVMVGSGNTALSTAYVDPFTLRAEIPAISSGSYPVYVVNSNGGTAIKINGLTTSPFPVWVTGTNLANTPSGNVFSVSLSGTSDSNITYSNTTALPAGTTLAANGLFSGIIPFVENDTTYNFTAVATDVELQNTSRAFSINVAPNFKLWGWGSDSGTNKLFNTGNRSSPVQLGSNADWMNVRGDGPKVAQKYDGTLWTWGNNNSGQLGINNRIDRSSPVQIGTGTEWSISSNFQDRVTSGGAIKNDGTLWVWGSNSTGGLGLNNRIARSSPTQVGTGTNWKKIVKNNAFTALKTDGTLWVCGQNDYGQLGLNDTVYRSSPVQVGTAEWSDVSNGTNLFVGIKIDGTLWSCGAGQDPYGSGGLGLNDQINRSSPTQVGTATNWSKIFTSSATNGVVAAIKTDGTLWTWGRGTEGQLGGPGRSTISSPGMVGSNTNWSKVAFGWKHTIALKTDGTLWTWGDNSDGQLGIGNRVSRSSPVQIGAGTNWYDIAGDAADASYNTTFVTTRN